MNHTVLGLDLRKATMPDAIAAMVDAWLRAQEGEDEGPSVQFSAPSLATSLVPVDGEPNVRFTVDLPRSLHKRLKLAAVERETPMTDLARQALGEWINLQRRSP
jgi:hypothetical protein